MPRTFRGGAAFAGCGCAGDGDVSIDWGVCRPDREDWSDGDDEEEVGLSGSSSGTCCGGESLLRWWWRRDEVDEWRRSVNSCDGSGSEMCLTADLGEWRGDGGRCAAAARPWWWLRTSSSETRSSKLRTSRYSRSMRPMSRLPKMPVHIDQWTFLSVESLRYYQILNQFRALKCKIDKTHL